ncbi:sugar transferase, partial [uncultured Ruminobacter sp.]|uniref:sugar transferase n=1 Tax=uncultured Ruminobacter sp. TaxID=538947 RepID=UPI0025EC93A0
ATPLQVFLKRSFDVAAGILGSIAVIILMAVVGPFIKRESPGPVLFRQERIGKNGKRFTMYKLRSMHLDAEERKKELLQQNRIKDGMMFKLDFDPRVIGNKVLPDGTKKTGIGEFIRRTSLDEYPQFFNVLKGDMSLVGTRPPTLDEWERYELHHRARLAVRPGITGLWQVSGRSEITDFEEVVRLDTEYITNWSPGMDLRILFKTIRVLVSRKGAL